MLELPKNNRGVIFGWINREIVDINGNEKFIEKYDVPVVIKYELFCVSKP